MSRWLLWPLLPHLVLKSQGYWSLHKGTGFSRGLGVWPRNPFSGNFPREKTCRSLEKPCEAWPAPRPLWAAFLSHLLCRLVMFHSLFPEQRQFKCKGQLCSAWTLPSFPSLSSTSDPFCCLFKLPSSAVSHVGYLGDLVFRTLCEPTLLTSSHPLPTWCPPELFASLGNNFLMCLSRRCVLGLSSRAVFLLVLRQKCSLKTATNLHFTLIDLVSN